MNLNSFLKQLREGMSPCKLDEIAALRNFASAFHPDTYLASLFNSDMLKWVERQIELDASTDLWAYAESIGRAAGEQGATAKKEADRLRAELKVAAEASVSLGETVERLRAEIQRQKEQIDALRCEREESREEADRQNRLIDRVRSLAMERWMDGKDVAPAELRDLLNADGG